MKPGANRFVRRVPILSAIFAGCLVSQATAATHTFTVSNNLEVDASLWASGNGWNTTPVSGPDTILTFSGNLDAGQTNFSSNNIASLSLNRINFNQAGTGAASTIAPVVTISGNPLEFVANGGTAPILNFGATGTVRPLTVVRNNLILSGDLTIMGAASATLSGQISGGGNVTKSGDGVVTISGASNTWSGNLSITGGALVFTDAGALSSGTITVTGTSSLRISGGITAGAGRTITINGQGAGSTGALAGGSGNNVWAGNVILGSASTRIGVADGGGSLTVSGGISGTGELVIRTAAAGQVVSLSGSNSYVGPTRVVIGVLSVGNFGSIGSGNSNLGNATNAANGMIILGNTPSDNPIVVPSLRYTGAGETTDRTIRLESALNTAINGTIEHAGTGTLKFTSNLVADGTAGKTLTLSSGTNATGEFAGVIGDGTGAGKLGITKTGVGTWVLSAANTYTGNTTVSSGMLVLANSSALGGSTTISAAGGSLGLSGGMTVGAGKTITISGAGSNSNGALQSFTGSNVWQGNVVLNGANARLGVADTGTSLEVTGVISAADAARSLQIRSSASTQVVKIGSENTYTGATSIVHGILSVDSIKSISAGIADGKSSLGAPVNETDGTITFGIDANNFSGNATLRYTGTGATTDRIIRLQSAGGASPPTLTATLDQSGTGLLKFTGNLATAETGIAGTVSGRRNLVFSGSTAGTGEFAGVISGVDAVIKNGTGTWTLSGVNTYTGATTVNAGTLVLTGGSIGGGTVTVAAGATLRATGDYTIGTAATGNLTVAGGGILSVADDATHTLTLANGVFTVGGTGTDSSILNFDLGATGVSDRIAAGTLTVNAAGAIINLGQITGTTLSAGTYTLFTHNSASGVSGLTVGTVPVSPAGKVATFSISGTSAATQLTVALASVSSTGRAYWTGTEGAVWNTVNGTTGQTNFVANADGSGAHDILPDATTDVYFTANTTQGGTSTILGQDLSVRSLHFTGSGTPATTAHTIGGANLLTIGSGGIVVDAASGEHIINTRLLLGASQTWDLAGTSGQKLTVNGTVSGATSDLTVTGGRTLVLTGANSYRNTSVGVGTTVEIGLAGGSTGSLGSGNITNNGIIDFKRSGATALSGVIGGGGNLIVSAGSLTLSGANTYSGTTTVKNGAAILVQNDTALGTTAGNTTVEKGGGLRFSGGITVAENFSLAPQVAGSSNDAIILNSAGNNTLTGTLTVTGDNANNFRFEAAAGSTLNIQGNVTGNNLFTTTTGLVTRGDGNINISGALSGFARLTIQGSNNTVTLSGQNRYTGATVSTGTNTVLVVDSINSTSAGGPAMASSSLGAPADGFGIIELGAGNTLRYVGTGETTNRGIDMTTGSITLEQSGSGTLNFTGAIRNTNNDTPKTLTLSGTGIGQISGSLADRNAIGITSLTKTGTGSWTLSGTAKTYTGATTVTGGRLRLSTSIGSTQVSVTGSSLELLTGNLIADGAALTLNNGTLIAGGPHEKLGTLTLTGTSQLDLTTVGNAVHFADSSASTWSGTLAILHWGGLSGGGVDGDGRNHIYFGDGSSTGLTGGQLARIFFVDPTIDGQSYTGNFNAIMLNTGEVVAVIPEPSAALLVILGSAAAIVRRRRK